MTYVLNATGRVHLNGSWTHTALSLPIHRQYGQNVTLTAEVQIDAKGRKRRLYKQWQTPFEKLLSLDRPQQFLRPGLSINALKRVAATMSDTEAARRMQQAKYSMFEQIRRSA